jgi:hypothetical protein
MSEVKVMLVATGDNACLVELSINAIAIYIVNRHQFLEIDESAFQSGDDDELDLKINETLASAIVTVDLSDNPNFDYTKLKRYTKGKPILVITRSGKKEGEVNEASSLTERLLLCNQDEMLKVIKAATQAEYGNRKRLKEENAHWWKSIRSSSVSLWPLNPSNFALATLSILFIGTVIAKYASLPTLTQVAPLLGDFMMLGAGFFGLTLITVAPFLWYEHYTAQRYKYWSNLERNKDRSYADHLNDLKNNTFKFGFFAYLRSVYDLAWENEGKALMIIGTIITSLLLALASVGFIYHYPIAEHVMQPFFDVITGFLTHAFSTLTAANIQILAAVAAPLFPLVILDTARRIIELFQKAKADSINPQFGSEETYCEMRPEYDSFAGMQESLGYHFSDFFTQPSKVEAKQNEASSSLGKLPDSGKSS